MSRSIIKTALTNPALPLELSYREPSASEGQASSDDLDSVRFAPRTIDHDLADEFACLLRAI